MRKYLTILVVALGGQWLPGCGAPTKSAGQVAALFTGNSVTLDDKLLALCSTLRSRSESPSANDLSMALDDCGSAGKSALNYNQIGTTGNPTGFLFNDYGAAHESNEETIRKTMRGQVWLNKTLLSLAQAVSSKMKSNEGMGAGVLSLPDSANGRAMTGLATPKITVLDKPNFDVKNLAFAMKINLKITGIVNADHDIAIAGRLIDGAIAVTVRTTEDRKYEQSIVKKFTAALLIVPHASDVYVDIIADIVVHNPGFGAAVESNVNKFLGSGLKGALDSLVTL